MKIKKITEKTEKVLNKNRQYSNSFGSGSTKVGSLGVVTLNLPRLAFKNINNEDNFLSQLKNLTEDTARINNAKRNILQKRIDNGNLPLYTYGFINLKKQYSTTGICGLNEACSIMGYDILTDEGQKFALKIINVINDVNEKAERQFGSPHNCEQIPAESTAVKLAQKDKLLKIQVDGFEYDLYSNQFIPLITNADLLDRIEIQGKLDKHFSGGAICHLNVETQLTDKEKMKLLIETSANKGVIYFAVNYNIQKCEDEHITVGKKETCDCGKKITDNFTRVVGFLVNTKAFNKIRRVEDYPNRQFYKDTQTKKSTETFKFDKAA